jgi:hypothetical protein
MTEEVEDKKGNKITVDFSKNPDVRTAIENDAAKAERPIGQYLRIWLRDNYLNPNSVA